MLILVLCHLPLLGILALQLLKQKIPCVKSLFEISTDDFCLTACTLGERGDKLPRGKHSRGSGRAKNNKGSGRRLSLWERRGSRPPKNRHSQTCGDYAVEATPFCADWVSGKLRKVLFLYKYKGKMLPKERYHLCRQATRLEDLGSSALNLNQLDGALGSDSPTQNTKAGSCLLPSDYMHEDTKALVRDSASFKVTKLA